MTFSLPSILPRVYRRCPRAPRRGFGALSTIFLAAIIASGAHAQGDLPGPRPTTPAAGATPPGLPTFEQQLSYALGVNIGQQFKQDGLPIDPAALSSAIADVLADAPLKMTDPQRRAVFAQLQQRMQKRQRERALARMPARVRQQAVKNQQEGATFLNANAQKPGVQTTASGLQYRVLQAGTGRSPTPNNLVRCNYEGRFINGEVFDASKKHGPDPAEFSVGGVIPGWTEALQLMKVGAKWQLYIPGELAYGLEGYPPKFGPDRALIFDIELVEIAR